MLAELFTWWSRQMAEIAAPVLRNLRPAAADALLFAPEPGCIRVSRRRGGRVEPVSIVPHHADPGVLRGLYTRLRRTAPATLVLPSPLLIRQATLPAAARANLDGVLRYEMDRLTPFAVDDVFFSHRLLEHDRGRGILRVELALAARSWVTPLLDRLAVSGIRPVALEALGPDGAARRIPIVQTDPAHARRQRALTRLAAAACAVLGIAVLAFPLARQSLALQAAEDRIAALRPQVRQVDALRRRIAAGSAGAGRIVQARQQAAAALRAIAVLTDTVPDDTWLTSLSLRQHALVIEGRSNAATKLLAAMGAEPALRNPAFAAPVMRGETGGELFTIQAEFGS